MRSKYMLSEYDNVKNGKVRLPEEFKDGVGKNEKGAVQIFQNVCSRTIMVEMMVDDTSMVGRMGTLGPIVDYGQKDKDAVKALNNVCPEDHVVVGMIGE
ncbi:hypothetical protein G7Y89_g12281 [Cudoniella acicularis]|uniref:Uncharacterized protein n=1 Tax=Cudoniella acicularis TaxID=354080 RepID=A0A8H4VX40_9HELO|nr:hypothetical protein G7Y89_g12281 [Cudoniella acicularis]